MKKFIVVSIMVIGLVVSTPQTASAAWYDGLINWITGTAPSSEVQQAPAPISANDAVVTNVSARLGGPVDSNNETVAQPVTFTFTLTAGNDDVYVSTNPSIALATSSTGFAQVTGAKIQTVNVNPETLAGDYNTSTLKGYFVVPAGSSRVFTYSGSLNFTNTDTTLKTFQLNAVRYGKTPSLLTSNNIINNLANAKVSTVGGAGTPTAPAPVIAIFNPAPSQSFLPGEILPIRWTSSNYIGSLVIDIQNQNGTTTLFSASSTSSTLSNTGSFDYQLPKDIGPGNYRIQVRGNNGLVSTVPFIVPITPTTPTPDQVIVTLNATSPLKRLVKISTSEVTKDVLLAKFDIKSPIDATLNSFRLKMDFLGKDISPADIFSRIRATTSNGKSVVPYSPYSLDFGGLTAPLPAGQVITVSIYADIGADTTGRLSGLTIVPILEAFNGNPYVVAMKDGKTVQQVIAPASLVASEVTFTTQEVVGGTSQVKVTYPNNGEFLLYQQSNTISYSGGKNSVWVGVIDDRTKNVIGWITQNAPASSTVVWNAFTLLDETRNVFELAKVSPGPYRIIVVSENSSGAFCTASTTTCNVDVSDKPFIIASNDPVVTNTSVTLGSSVISNNKEVAKPFSMNFGVTAGASTVYLDKNLNVMLATSSTGVTPPSSVGIVDVVVNPASVAGDSSTYYVVPAGSTRMFTLSGTFRYINTPISTRTFQINGIKYGNTSGGTAMNSITKGVASLKVLTVGGDGGSGTGGTATTTATTSVSIRNTSARLGALITTATAQVYPASFNFTVTPIGGNVYLSKTSKIIPQIITTPGTVVEFIDVTTSPISLAGDTSTVFVVPAGTSRNFTVNYKIKNISSTGTISTYVTQIAYGFDALNPFQRVVKEGLTNLRVTAIFPTPSTTPVPYITPAVSVSPSTSPTPTVTVSEMVVWCTAYPSSAVTGQTVTWNPKLTGGSGGPYTYTWTDDSGLSYSSASLTRTYSTTGARKMTLKIQSPTQVKSGECSINITQAPQTTSSPSPSPTTTSSPEATTSGTPSPSASASPSTTSSASPSPSPEETGSPSSSPEEVSQVRRPGLLGSVFYAIGDTLDSVFGW